MAYEKRYDDRKVGDLRPMSAKVGIIPNAKGSAEFKIGKTWAIAAVYGPREVYPRFLSNPKKGILRCHYSMMPFSGSGERSDQDEVEEHKKFPWLWKIPYYQL